METSTYTIEGMTCQACVKTITEKVSEIRGVLSTQIDLVAKKATISSSRKIETREVTQALASSPKYKVSELKNQTANAEKKESLFKTYKPLILVFTFVLLVSLAYQVSLGSFASHLFMNHIMAGFFIGLSFFKFFNLNAFSESFSSYDPIAQRWLGYGKVYPFIELILGLLFVSGQMLLLANAVTILILSITTYGVYLRLQSKSKFQCACLGTNFNLPLSNVTIAENLVMIAMAGYSLAAM